MKKINLIICICLLGSLVIGQDSLNMTKLARLDNMPGVDYNDIWGYTDSQGNEIAIVGSSDAINLVDVTDCMNPVLDTSFIDGSSVIWRDFKTYDHYAYAVCDGSACQNEGLQVIDMDTKTMTQSNAHFNKAHNIYIDVSIGRLYAVGVDGSKDLVIFDLIPDPANPTHLSTINFGAGVPNYIHDIYVKDHIGYASHGYEGFVIYDFTDPVNPVELGSYTSPGYNHSSWNDSLSGVSYVAFEVPTGVPINILEVGNNYSIIKKGEFSDPILNAPTLNRPHNPFIKGDSLYISYYHDGTQVWNIEDELNPFLASSYETDISNSNYNGFIGCWGTYPYFESGCLVSSDINKGLYTFKLLPAKVELGGSYLVFEDENKGLVLTDENGNKFEITVNSNGDLDINPFVPSGDKVMVKNSDIQFDTQGVGIVLKDDDNNYHLIKVDTNNDIVTQRVNLPSQRITVETQIDFSTGENGVYVVSDNNETVRLTIVNGQIVPVSWPY